MSNRKKVRVEFRKNRQKRTRANDLTRNFVGPTDVDHPEGQDDVASERVRAKGDLSRHRTIIQDLPAAAVKDGKGKERDRDSDDEGPLAHLAVDTSKCRLGRVMRIHGLFNIVQSPDGREVRCQTRRILKTIAIEGRNILAVGDRVWYRPQGEDEGFIEKVETRRGIITRGYRNREHVLVANVDALWIVSAFAEPGLKLPLVDRYIVSAENGKVQPVIVLNKADLIDLKDYQWVFGLYAQLGYEVVVASATDGRGIARLRELLMRPGTTALSGQSGVGKSSLLNAIQPGLNLRVREVSQWTFKGKHTTTTASLLPMGGKSFVIDTPGLRQFELWDIPPALLELYFREFGPYVPHCRYPDCSHTHEDSCAVKEAVLWGQIHEGRYESYLKLYHQQPIDGAESATSKD